MLVGASPRANPIVISPGGLDSLWDIAQGEEDDMLSEHMLFREKMYAGNGCWYFGVRIGEHGLDVLMHEYGPAHSNPRMFPQEQSPELYYQNRGIAPDDLVAELYQPIRYRKEGKIWIFKGLSASNKKVEEEAAEEGRQADRRLGMGRCQKALCHEDRRHDKIG